MHNVGLISDKNNTLDLTVVLQTACAIQMNDNDEQFDLFYPADVVFAQHCQWPSPFLRHASGQCDRAFPAAASRTWNSLPPEVTSSTTLSTFKSKLKTSFQIPDA